MMMDFRKVERVPLSESIADRIEEAIIERAVSPDSQLPPEHQLATQFGVSRNVVREAFKLLKERGLIKIENGNGAFVARPSTETTSNALGRYLRFSGSSQSISDLYQVRRLLEGETVRLAALHATDDDLEELEMRLEDMAHHIHDVDAWASADLAFHLALARAAKNPLFLVLLQPLVEQLRHVISTGFHEAGAAERGYQAHRELVSRIKEKDPDGSRTAMLQHLNDSQARLERLDSE